VDDPKKTKKPRRSKKQPPEPKQVTGPIVTFEITNRGMTHPDIVTDTRVGTWVLAPKLGWFQNHQVDSWQLYVDGVNLASYIVTPTGTCHVEQYMGGNYQYPVQKTFCLTEDDARALCLKLVGLTPSQVVSNVHPEGIGTSAIPSAFIDGFNEEA
jgi:hypothetical protein